MKFLAGKRFPFCRGCGHHGVVVNTARALERIGAEVEDVVVVSDIGCCGLVDPLLKCHTIHGLHGRACALALGVKLGSGAKTKKENDNGHGEKKVIAFQGDGGATIGLQHLLECARRNVDVTLIVQNNMIYGMTGGQVSGLSPLDVRRQRLSRTPDVPPYDLPSLVDTAGGAFSVRITGVGDYSDILAEALSVKGFSLVEVLEACTSYGVSPRELLSRKEEDIEILRNDAETFELRAPRNRQGLFDDLSKLSVNENATLESPLRLIVAGSAGEGVQTAAELLALAAISSGYNAVKKGRYPITVGSGFSIGEVIISPDEIFYAGIDEPDILMMVSRDGKEACEELLSRMRKGTVVFDSDLDVLFPSGPEIVPGDFRKRAGAKGAALAAIASYFTRAGVISRDTFRECAGLMKHTEGLKKAIEEGVGSRVRSRGPSRHQGGSPAPGLR